MQEGLRALREAKSPDAFFGIRSGSHNSLGVPIPDKSRIQNLARLPIPRFGQEKPSMPVKHDYRGVNASSFQLDKDTKKIARDFNYYVGLNQGVLRGKEHLGGDYIANPRYVPDDRGIGPFGDMSTKEYVSRIKSGDFENLPFDSPLSKELFKRHTGRRGSY